MAAVDPLPFVPATWRAGKAASGCPRRASASRIRSSFRSQPTDTSSPARYAIVSSYAPTDQDPRGKRRRRTTAGPASRARRPASVARRAGRGTSRSTMPRSRRDSARWRPAGGRCRGVCLPPPGPGKPRPAPGPGRVDAPPGAGGAGEDRRGPPRPPTPPREPLHVRATIHEAERIGGAPLGITLAKRASVDDQTKPLIDGETPVVPAVRADVEPPRQAPGVHPLPAPRTALLSASGVARRAGHPRQTSYPARAGAAARIACRTGPRKPATRAGAALALPSSTWRAIALPMMTASAKAAIHAACSARLTPKPTPTGRVVTCRTRRTHSGSADGRSARAPVVPSTETK